MINPQNNIIDQMQSFLIENAKQAYECYNTFCFNIFIHPKDSFSYLNYVIPSKIVNNNFKEEYKKVENIFKDNDRKVRFEFLEESSPNLPSQLISVGLKEEYRVDFMIYTENSFIKPTIPTNFSVYSLDKVTSSERLKNFRLIQELSFDENSDLSIDLIDERDVLSNIGQGIGLIGYIDDIPVSACQYTKIINGITEIVGTATLPKYRCNGFGSHITTMTIEKAFESGANIACLSAANEKVSKIYEKIGFHKIGTMLAYS